MVVKSTAIMTDFKAAWEALPPELQRAVRDSIKEGCRLRSDHQFNDRRTGRVRIREYEKDVIMRSFAIHGVNATTGELE